MTSFDDYLKKKQAEEEPVEEQEPVVEQKKPIIYKSIENRHQKLQFKKEPAVLTESEIDKKISSLLNEKKKLDAKTKTSEPISELVEERKDTIPPGIDQKIVNAIYNNPKKHFSLRRKEKQMILGKETEDIKSKQWMIFILTIIGIFVLMSLRFMIQEEWTIIIVLLLGSSMFLPAGMILGWAVLDPYVRCKILRKVSKKNYGVINFVGKGQKIVSKIKNFDLALVWKKNETWVITKEHVYQLSKDGDSIVEKAKIDPESIVTLIDTVPVLFVDLDSMQPLSLARDRREGINPLELGATLKAWVDNQLAKAMFLKKTMDIYLIIIIIVSVLSLGMNYMNMTKFDDLSLQFKTIQLQLGDILSRLNTP